MLGPRGFDMESQAPGLLTSDSLADMLIIKAEPEVSWRGITVETSDGFRLMVLAERLSVMSDRKPQKVVTYRTPRQGVPLSSVSIFEARRITETPKSL